jgi:chromosome partitioning protein
MVSDTRRLQKMSQALAADRPELREQDYILIDCPPSLNLLTINALVAAHSVLVPLQCEFFALEGLSQLMRTVQTVRQSSNPRLKIQGIVLTMYDRRNNLSGQVAADVRENLGTLVYDTVIPRNVRLSEAPSHAVPALIYDRSSSGSLAYQRLAGELLARMGVARAVVEPA